MRYYFGKIEIQIGGHELTYAFKFKTEIDPDDYLIMVCSDFFGDSEDVHGDNVFSFDGGSIYTSPYDFQEVTQEMWEKTTILNNIKTYDKEAA